MDIQLKKGLLDVCVLKYLSIEDSYGYGIINNIKEYIEISESTLYPILKRLEESNHLETYKEEHNGRLRKYYKITGKGIERLDDFKNEYKYLKKIANYILGGNNED